MTDQLRKVAVLVNALDSESAKVLLGQMSTDQARKVRETLKKMGKIDPQEQLAVLQNFSEEQKTATQKKATTSKGFSVEEEFQQSDFSALQKTLSSDYLPTNPL
ncbi:MAG: hypothetical protein MPJ24_06165, partial [Pirellulaceae bacterium]|nr:hypothetical protein [Pirellulaceae bacterium]